MTRNFRTAGFWMWGLACVLGVTSAIAEWKRWTARQEGIHWQKGFFDHRLRNNASLMEKREYILLNPTRAGLVAKPSDWPYLFDECE